VEQGSDPPPGDAYVYALRDEEAYFHRHTRSTAAIGLAAPGRPIGPWSRRAGAAQASATERSTAVTSARTQQRCERRPGSAPVPSAAMSPEPAHGHGDPSA
jgi:hypothetical protein